MWVINDDRILQVKCIVLSLPVKILDLLSLDVEHISVITKSHHLWNGISLIKRTFLEVIDHFRLHECTIYHIHLLIFLVNTLFVFMLIGNRTSAILS